MPEGQFTGSKGTYVYESDSGETYSIRRDETLAAPAGLGFVELLPESAPAGFQGVKPTNLRPRGVYWEGTLNGVVRRKFLIAATPAATLYQSNARTALTIDGVAGFTTGRKGERLSFT